MEKISMSVIREGGWVSKLSCKEGGRRIIAP